MSEYNKDYGYDKNEPRVLDPKVDPRGINIIDKMDEEKSKKKLYLERPEEEEVIDSMSGRFKGGSLGSSGGTTPTGTIEITSISESSESGGSSVVTFSDGKTLTVKNGKDGKAGTNGKDGVNNSTLAIYTMTAGSDTATCDKTYADLLSAYDSGSTICARIIVSNEVVTIHYNTTMLSYSPQNNALVLTMLVLVVSIRSIISKMILSQYLQVAKEDSYGFYTICIT